MNWKEEFGEEYDVPPEIHEHYEDQSCGNESSPNFLIDTYDDKFPRTVVYVEHPEEEKRFDNHRDMSQKYKRYSVMRYREPGNCDRSESLLETDDLAEALAKIEEVTK